MLSKRIKVIFNQRVVQPLLGLLRAGATPHKLALAVAMGCIMGIFPVFATPTIICIGLAFIFRVNQAAIQIANYAMYPLQFILWIPFVQLGLVITGEEVSRKRLEELLELITEDIWSVFQELITIFWAGIIGWTLFAIPFFLLSYHASLKLFKARLATN